MSILHYTPRLSVLLFAAVLPFASLQAGDDTSATRAENVPVSTQMNEYLKGQKIAHTVDTKGGDSKGSEGAEILTVKIYDVSADAQQSAICTALAATAKKGHVREATVMFYTQAQTANGQVATFQPSRLPSGNGGDAEFPRDAQLVSYRLLRTVKL